MYKTNIFRNKSFYKPLNKAAPFTIQRTHRPFFKLNFHRVFRLKSSSLHGFLLYVNITWKMFEFPYCFRHAKILRINGKYRPSYKLGVFVCIKFGRIQYILEPSLKAFKIYRKSVFILQNFTYWMGFYDLIDTNWDRFVRTYILNDSSYTRPDRRRRSDDILRRNILEIEAISGF